MEDGKKYTVKSNPTQKIKIKRVSFQE